MGDMALFVLGGIDFPKLFDANAELRRLLALVQIELFDQLLGEVPARAFGEDGVLAAQFKTGLEGIFMLARFRDTHVTRYDTADGTVFIICDFSRGKAGINFNTQRFGLATQPTYNFT